MRISIEWNSNEPELIALAIVESKADQEDLCRVQNALFDVWSMIESLNGRQATLSDRLAEMRSRGREKL